LCLLRYAVKIKIMKENKKLFKLIENKKEPKNIFKNTIQKTSDPIKKQMVKFLHQNLISEQETLKSFFKFKPRDLQ